MDFRVDCSKYNYETPLSVEELLLKSIKIDLIETSTYFNKVKGNKRIFYAISIENLAEYFELSNEIIIFFLNDIKPVYTHSDDTKYYYPKEVLHLIANKILESKGSKALSVLIAKIIIKEDKIYSNIYEELLEQGVETKSVILYI